MQFSFQILQIFENKLLRALSGRVFHRYSMNDNFGICGSKLYGYLASTKVNLLLGGVCLLLFFEIYEMTDL